MKRRFLSLFLAVLLCFGVLSMSACSISDLKDGLFGPTEKTYSEEELEKIVSGVLAERDETNFSVHDIIINSEGNTNLLAASKGLLSAVSVYSTFKVQTLSGFGPYAQWVTSEATSGGAGVIFRMSEEDKVKGDAYIITNYHVVYNSSSTAKNKIASKIEVYLYGMEQERYAIDAEFVGGSMLYDIALLKVSDSGVIRSSNAIEAELANSDDVAVLETAIAIGNPALGGISATVGHINVDSEYVPMTLADDTTSAEMRLMRIDTAVNGGNSGGGLYNDRGQLIGIVNAKIVSSKIDNIGYAIPSNVVKNVAESILYYCDGTSRESISRALLGITLEGTPESYTRYDSEAGKVHIIEKVKIAEVSDNCLASGKLQKGDLVRAITVGGVRHEITRKHNITETMLCARVGDTVVIELERAGTVLEVSVTITESALTDVK